PLGTGQTMLARTVSGVTGVPFLFASGSEFDKVLVGVGAKHVAIILVHELDAIGGKRSSRDQHYMQQTLNQLLVEMDNFLQNEGIIVIAATHLFSRFPKSVRFCGALVCPSRFVPLRAILYIAEVDFMILARGTVGISGADPQSLVNRAAVKAARDGAKAVDIKYCEWAKPGIIMGAEWKSTFISEDMKRATAYYEGGHVPVAMCTEGAMASPKVFCTPRG
ncbi:P-loop containing nucleoside triphosphate hydrolase protein, partial [Trametes coccinea BRFM310]